MLLGAVAVALGSSAAGVYSNDEALWKIFEQVFDYSIRKVNSVIGSDPCDLCASQPRASCFSREESSIDRIGEIKFKYSIMASIFLLVIPLFP